MYRVQSSVAMQKVWWAHQDLNLEPTDYESAALTVELWARKLNLAGVWGHGLVVTVCPTSAKRLGTEISAGKPDPRPLFPNSPLL